MSECHTTHVPCCPSTNQAIALVGNANVGKSVLFQHLTGRYVTVANYPGTTVEISRGVAQALPATTVIDTPGIVAFPPRSEDEHVVSRLLLNQPLQAIVQVGDAKQIKRTLLLAVQLAELEVPLVVALNMMDEATARGVKLDPHLLAELLDVPVVPLVAVRGQGIDTLTATLERAAAPRFALDYGEVLEPALAALAPRLPESPIAPRALALLWLSGDEAVEGWVSDHLPADAYHRLEAERAALQEQLAEPLCSAIQQVRLAHVDRLAAQVLLDHGQAATGRSVWLTRQLTHPLWGLPILGLVLYGIYLFVGVFGASTLVGLLEEDLFGNIVTPWLTRHAQALLPELAASLVVGEYGLWTMGMTYALALVLPIVTTFFIAFGVLEDSGYLPRLVVLSNRMFKLLGLNGKAILPMVLGLGCVTMATMTTRVLESRRDRLLVILLLALAVPCSAQLGVVLGMLASISFTATLIWSGVMLAVLMTVGWLAARLLPGERSPLLVELPPLRMPVARNILIKTVARLEWYLKEVVPLFLLGTALVFVLDRVRVLPWITRAAEPLVSGWLGLPPEAAPAFLLGFLRRDFGATGLFSLADRGLLSPLQVVTAMVTITLFIPCVASVMIIVKERGARTAAAMSTLIFPLAFLVGGLLYRGLLAVGWGG